MKLSEMKPDEVCGWIQSQIRNLFGDRVENDSAVYARNGYYFVELVLGKRTFLSGALRRHQVGRWLRGI